MLATSASISLTSLSILSKEAASASSGFFRLFRAVSIGTPKASVRALEIGDAVVTTWIRPSLYLVKYSRVFGHSALASFRPWTLIAPAIVVKCWYSGGAFGGGGGAPDGACGGPIASPGIGVPPKFWPSGILQALDAHRARHRCEVQVFRRRIWRWRN